MTTADELKKYELMLILSGDLTESDFEKEFSELRKSLQENTKGIFYEESWGRRDFAYKIKKQLRGYYVIFDFNAGPQDIAELRINIKLNPLVLRHLLTILSFDYEPERYKQEIFRPEREREPIRKKPSRPVETLEKIIHPFVTSLKPTLAGKEEVEKLETVEKKLEEILENPDINIT